MVGVLGCRGVRPALSRKAVHRARRRSPMSRLVVISNRLPFVVRSSTQSGTYELSPSAGGLVSALGSYIERRRREDPAFECIWLGWPGASVEPEARAALSEQALRQHGAVPVYLEEREASAFYHGFCNTTLWPLFHYFPTYAEYGAEDFANYQTVNLAFCDAALSVIRPGDTVWVHDYQLLLLPKLLRERLADVEIGFFLHIPFPSFEIFRHLPSAWRRQLLEGMLGADLIGFHTHDYTQYFLRSVFRTLGHEHHFGEITVGAEVRRAETFPIGIDYERFHRAAQSSAVVELRQQLERGLQGRKAIFSVDRLDYSKGILQRLHGFAEFLQAHPEWQGRVVFVLVVVPSRTQVPQYQTMKHELDELVGRINGTYGSVDWVPILYQYRAVEFDELVALYNLAPVALITPLRDGMNLVAKEYLASKPDGSGVLILSEMAGAARELGEALLINPNHGREIADALHEALTLSPEEQVRRNQPMQERLRRYDAERWVSNFLDSLSRVKSRQGRLATHHLVGPMREALLDRYRAARRRLILLDYDGTLVPFASQPHLAAPDPALLRLIGKLAAEPHNHLYIISGRDRHTLDGWFKGLPLRIIAEHGAWLRDDGAVWDRLKPLNSEWKEQLAPLIQLYVDRVPGSLLEEKDYSLAWHYRRADPELGAGRAKELIDELVSYTANFDVQVLEGKKVVEVRNAGVNKGNAALGCVVRVEPDFILAAGDDQTDEDLFRALPQSAYTVRVGIPHSHAAFHLEDHVEVRELLEALATRSVD
jgi:trehalose 6-phosphate synthase/phosphatase